MSNCASWFNGSCSIIENIRWGSNAGDDQIAPMRATIAGVDMLCAGWPGQPCPCGGMAFRFHWGEEASGSAVICVSCGLGAYDERSWNLGFTKSIAGCLPCRCGGEGAKEVKTDSYRCKRCGVRAYEETREKSLAAWHAIQASAESFYLALGKQTARALVERENGAAYAASSAV